MPETQEALTVWKTKWRKKKAWVISGYDDRGLMYGLLDVALQINSANSIKSPMSNVNEITEKQRLGDLESYSGNAGGYIQQFANFAKRHKY